MILNKIWKKRFHVVICTKTSQKESKVYIWGRNCSKSVKKAKKFE